MNGNLNISGDHSAIGNTGLVVTGTKNNFGISIQSTSVTKGTAPSAQLNTGIGFYGSNMSAYTYRLANIEQVLSTANVSSLQLLAYHCSTATNTGTCMISVNVDASGNAYTSAPTPAQTDDSTKIATTAYVKDCVPKSVGDANTPVYVNANGVVTSTGKSFANYVATSGNQTIAGNKTFSGQVILTKNTGVSSSAANAVALIVGGAQTAAHLELDSNEIMAKSNGTTATTLYVGGGNGAVSFTTTATAPYTTNVITLGASGKVWKQLYAATTTISTSDERQKQQIEDIPDEVLDAWEEVEFKQFKFSDSVEEKGSENARIHMGVIAQQIKKVFEKHNLDPFKYGFFCYDEWDVHEDPKDENSPVIRRENGYAIRYEEALIIEAAYQRRRLDRIEAKLKLLLKEGD